jgi:hypothetical protein
MKPASITSSIDGEKYTAIICGWEFSLIFVQLINTQHTSNMNRILICILICTTIVYMAEAQKIAVKTNLLYDATATANIGIEYAITKQISASISANYNGWSFAGNTIANPLYDQRYDPSSPSKVPGMDDASKATKNRLEPQMWKHLLVQPEARYWIREVYNEHYIGLHGIYSTFDFSYMSLPFFGFTRNWHYMEGTAMGGGLSYGYNIYLTPRMNLELSLGGGFLNLKYKKFTHDYVPQPADGTRMSDNPNEPAYLDAKYITRSYIGPTMIGITFVYIIM